MDATAINGSGRGPTAASITLEDIGKTYPDGTVRPLIHIDDWDFNWQSTYTFAQPIPLPAGTRIDMVATFDNSAANVRQPSHPPRPVSWGEGTTDEMAIVFLGITVDSERLGWRPR